MNSFCCPFRSSVESGERKHLDLKSVYKKLQVDNTTTRMIHETETGNKFWLIAGYEQVKRILNDKRLSLDPSYANLEYLNDRSSQSSRFFISYRHLLTTDRSAQHTRLRKLLANAFMPKHIQKQREFFTSIATALMDAMNSHHTVDLIQSFIEPFVLRSSGFFLGVPTQDQTMIFHWVKLFLRVTDSMPDPSTCLDAEKKLCHYFKVLFEENRYRHDGSIFSILMSAHNSGELLQEELIGMSILLLITGVDTLLNMIGNGVHALLFHNNAWDTLCHGKASLTTSIDELLRIQPPVRFTLPRYAVTAIPTPAGVIQPGDVVFIHLASLNNDGAYFDNPHQLNLSRQSTYHHVSFGHGHHGCLGSSLARLQLEIALEGLSSRFPAMHLAVEPSALIWKQHPFMTGLLQLPVRLSSD